MSWVLIIFLGTSVATAPGFSTQKKCEDAGNKLFRDMQPEIRSGRIPTKTGTFTCLKVE